jgi:hypothetical protein
MPANVTTDKFMPSRTDASVAQPTTLSASRAIDSTSLSLVDPSTWPEHQTIALITYKKDANDDTKIDKSTLKIFLGIRNSETITDLTLTAGTDDGNDSGDYAEMAPTSEMFQRLFEGLTKEHKLDGSHADITVDSISTGGSDKLVFSTSSTQPSATSGKTIVWFKPLS